MNKQTTLLVFILVILIAVLLIAAAAPTSSVGGAVHRLVYGRGEDDMVGGCGEEPDNVAQYFE